MLTTLSRKKRSSRKVLASTISSSGTVGGAHDAHVHRDLPVPAQPGELRILQHLQHLGLQARAHLPDLVQEDRAAVGDLEAAGLARVARP